MTTQMEHNKQEVKQAFKDLIAHGFNWGDVKFWAELRYREAYEEFEKMKEA